MYVNNICCEKFSCVTEFKTVVSSSVLLCKVKFVLLFCNQYCASMNSAQVENKFWAIRWYMYWQTQIMVFFPVVRLPETEGCLCHRSLPVLTQDISLVSLVTCLLCWHKGLVHSCQQKSIGLKFSKSQTGSDVRYSCHHNSSHFTFPIFAHLCRFSIHSLQSITLRIY